MISRPYRGRTAPRVASVFLALILLCMCSPGLSREIRIGMSAAFTGATRGLGIELDTLRDFGPGTLDHEVDGADAKVILGVPEDIQGLVVFELHVAGWSGELDLWKSVELCANRVRPPFFEAITICCFQGKVIACIPHDRDLARDLSIASDLQRDILIWCLPVMGDS